MLISIKQIAVMFGVKSSDVRQLLDSKKLPHYTRVSEFQVFDESDVPAIGDALIAAGYIPESTSNRLTPQLVIIEPKAGSQ